MKKIIFITIILSFCEVNAQNLFPTFEEKPIWITEYKLYLGSNSNSIYVNYITSFTGIKSINDTVYYETQIPFNGIFYIRYEGKKVFRRRVRNPNTDSVIIYKENLVFDFAKNVGDTLSTIGDDDQMTSIHVDSVKYFKFENRFYKIMNISYMIYLQKYSSKWIEGIGDTANLPFLGVRKFSKLGILSYKPISFQKNDIFIYKDSVLIADTLYSHIPLSSMNYSGGFMLEIFPNPSEGFVTISTTQAINSISIIDLFNKSYPVTLINNSVDIAELPKGIYILKINVNKKNYYEKIYKD